jgi:hypothetical protein
MYASNFAPAGWLWADESTRFGWVRADQEAAHVVAEAAK